MLRGSFMVCLLELRISDVGFAVFAPVLWLSNQSISKGVGDYAGKQLTVDFQYSDILPAL